MSYLGHFATDQYDSDPEDTEVTKVKIMTPHPMASFRETDAWLADRGWEPDGRSWRSVHRGRVTIATHEEAVRIQRRRDRRASPPETDQGSRK